MADLDWRNDNETDDRLNPAELHNREQASGSENSGSSGGSGDSTTQNIDNARDAESAGGVDSWANNVSGTGGRGSSAGGIKNKFLGGLKKITGSKAAPVGILGGGMIGLLSMGGFFIIPSAIIAQITEVLSQRWSFQQVPMKSSNDKILRAKLGGVASCGTMSIRCKFQTFSKAEVDAMKKQGITLEGGKDPILDKGGRKKAKKLVFTYGETNALGNKTTVTKEYTPRQALSELRKPNSRLSVAMTSAYNHNQYGYGDSRFKKVAAKLKIKKSRPMTDEDQKDRESTMKKIKTLSEEGGKKPDHTPGGVSCKDDEGNTRDCNQDETERGKKTTEGAEEISKAADDVSNSNKKMEFTGGETSIAGKIGALGWLHSVCDAASLFNTIENAAKVIRAAQLIPIGMMIVTTGHMIKSGDAKPSDGRSLGDLLTMTVIKKDGTRTKAATDSFGYRNAAFKDTDMTEKSMQYAIAGGYIGVVQQLKDTLYDEIGGKKNVHKYCKIINNSAVKAVSTGAGIALALFPPTTGPALAKIAAQTVGGMAIDFILSKYVIPMAINALAGQVIDGEIFGEDLGEAAVTGYIAAAGGVAAGGGSIPLMPEQAAQNAVEMDVVSKQNAIYERATRSPWDINSPYTMMGGVLNQFIPYLSSFSSVQGTMSALGSVATKSLVSVINPKASAAQRIETAKDYTSNDDTYFIEDIASTRQGGIVYGLPSEVLNITPEEAYKFLMAHSTEGVPDPHIDLETGEPRTEKFKRFIDKCVTPRDVPFGTEGGGDWDTEEPTSGLECMVYPEGDERLKPFKWMKNPRTISEAKQKIKEDAESNPPKTDPEIPSDKSSDYETMTNEERIYFLAWNNHLRTIQNREEGFKPMGGDSGGSASSAPAAGPGAPENTEKKGKGWSLKKGEDYSGTACASGGEGKVETHSMHQTKMRICDGGPIENVNALISANIQKMVEDSKAQGVNLSGSSFRSVDEQIALRKANGCPGINAPSSSCSPPTARPGSSMHELGLAIDFRNCSRGSACFKWLSSNASKYGLINLPSESWHWSTSGT